MKNSRKRSIRCGADDLGVGDVDRAAAARQPMQRHTPACVAATAIAHSTIRDVAVGDRARDPQDPDARLPDQVVDEVRAVRAPAQGHDQEHGPPTWSSR